MVGVVALLAGVVGALIGAALDDDPQPAAPATEAVETATVTERALAVRRVAEEVGPSVVTISADIEGTVGEAVGTGIVVSSDGQILTNAHVVEDASEIRVRLPGETEPTTAELLAVDVGNDLALLQIDAERPDAGDVRPGR